MKAMMNVIKRTFEGNAILAYIDLLGVRNFYKKTPVEASTRTMYSALLEHFAFDFSEHFKDEIAENFDVNIYGDSVVICQRLTTPDIVPRFTEFLLHYQLNLLTNQNIASRALVYQDSFFSLNVTSASSDTILGSRYTNISLCGGRGIVSVDETLKGLPMGVYVSGSLKNKLSEDLSGRSVRVLNEELLFIKQVDGIITALLPESTRDLFINSEITPGEEQIKLSLENSNFDKDTIVKWLPWIAVHLGIAGSEITRSKDLERKPHDC